MERNSNPQAWPVQKIRGRVIGNSGSKFLLSGLFFCLLSRLSISGTKPEIIKQQPETIDPKLPVTSPQILLDQHQKNELA